MMKSVAFEHDPMQTKWLTRQFREIGIPADRIITEEFEFR
jgi:hypothetical protein